MRRSLQPTERDDQECLFAWAEIAKGQMPELELLFAIPNGGSRDHREAARMKAAGVKAGVPDICLPVPRGGSSGLFVELKRGSGGRVSSEQRAWLQALAEQGYAVRICFGFDEAVSAITRYLQPAVQAAGDNRFHVTPAARLFDPLEAIG
jgi:hypothetical protein